MILSDYHVHTTFCDGKNTPGEIVEKAIEIGLKRIGFSAHSYTYFDESYCLKKDKIAEYLQEINSLKIKYQDKIKILCGIEKDYYSTMDTSAFDYVIGSVHYVQKNGEYLEIDGGKDKLIEIIKNHYKNDVYELIADYFNNICDVLDKTNADIVGHLDLITKYNQDGKLFNEKDARYVNAYKKAVDRLLEKNALFEVNVGGIARGYKTKPYPSPDILDYIAKKGGRVILASDSHNKDTLCYQFDKWGKYLLEKGLKIVDII